MVSISFNSLKGSHEVDIFETSAWGEENFISWQPINRELAANLNESKQQPLITYSQWLTITTPIPQSGSICVSLYFDLGKLEKNTNYLKTRWIQWRSICILPQHQPTSLMNSLAIQGLVNFVFLKNSGHSISKFKFIHILDRLESPSVLSICRQSIYPSQLQLSSKNEDLSRV